MVDRRSLYLVHLLDHGIPPALENKWMTGAGNNEADETTCRSLCTADDLSFVALAENGRAFY